MGKRTTPKDPGLGRLRPPQEAHPHDAPEKLAKRLRHMMATVDGGPVLDRFFAEFPGEDAWLELTTKGTVKGLPERGWLGLPDPPPRYVNGYSPVPEFMFLAQVRHTVRCALEAFEAAEAQGDLQTMQQAGAVVGAAFNCLRAMSEHYVLGAAEDALRLGALAVRMGLEPLANYGAKLGAPGGKESAKKRQRMKKANEDALHSLAWEIRRKHGEDLPIRELRKLMVEKLLHEDTTELTGGAIRKRVERALKTLDKN